MPNADKYFAIRKFLSQHTDLIELKAGQSRATIAPQWQGRIMTATSGGIRGPSYGWINVPYIQSGRLDETFSNYGGLERLWIGPEVGKYGFWIKPGKRNVIKNWQTPPALNTAKYYVSRHNNDRIDMTAKMELTNHAGTTFKIKVERSIRMLGKDEIWQEMGTCPSKNTTAVAIESRNRLVNSGNRPWRQSSGLASIWTIGQFHCGPDAWAVFPLAHANKETFALAVSDDYYGKLGPGRLKLLDSCAVMRCDGIYRSKIGVRPAFAKDTIASYDRTSGTLVIVRHSFPAGAANMPYVNSRWRRASLPYNGDVTNCYNDGPLVGKGKTSGFHELETSSPAADLAPGESVTHISKTYIFQGNEYSLRPLSRRSVGLDIGRL